MQSPTLNALFLIAACAIATGATAQNTYKCGNSYSQTPCPGGSVVDTRDPRSRAQKTQTDLATVRDAKVADVMESSRLKKEKTDRATSTPREYLPSAYPEKMDSMASATSTKQAKKKEAAPFTARVPGEKKKKTALKKKAKTKKISKA